MQFGMFKVIAIIVLYVYYKLTFECPILMCEIGKEDNLLKYFL